MCVSYAGSVAWYHDEKRQGVVCVVLEQKIEPAIVHEVAFALDCLCGKQIHCNMDDMQEIREFECAECGRVITTSFHITIYVQKEVH